MVPREAGLFLKRSQSALFLPLTSRRALVVVESNEPIVWLRSLMERYPESPSPVRSRRHPRAPEFVIAT